MSRLKDDALEGQESKIFLSDNDVLFSIEGFVYPTKMSYEGKFLSKQGDTVFSPPRFQEDVSRPPRTLLVEQNEG